ncbi:hypothetical protein [Aquabacterium sp.]|uniref:hypothetical protein n=1 Tax=Aquabacterium sp. TaxID=1872578 RepID=UPI003D6DA76F
MKRILGKIFDFTDEASINHSSFPSGKSSSGAADDSGKIRIRACYTNAMKLTVLLAA